MTTAVLHNVEKDTFVQISNITHYTIRHISSGSGPFHIITKPIIECATPERFRSLYDDCAGYIQILAHISSDACICIYRDRITFDNHKTAKDDAIAWLTNLLEGLSEYKEI